MGFSKSILFDADTIFVSPLNTEIKSSRFSEINAFKLSDETAETNFELDDDNGHNCSCGIPRINFLMLSAHVIEISIYPRKVALVIHFH